MEFTKTELTIIMYALKHEVCDLRQKIETADEDYKNERGEWGITHGERDEYLYKRTSEILDKIRTYIREY